MAIINQWPMSETKVLGGGGPGMYSIVLPRSVYWASASEWIQVNSQQPPANNDNARPQVVCNGNLWVAGINQMSAVDLTTGEVVDTISSTSINPQYTAHIATDGERYIAMCNTAYGRMVTVYAYVVLIDVVSKTAQNIVTYAFSDQGNNGKYGYTGPIVYSSFYNSFFIFGARSTYKQTTSSFSQVAYRYDLGTNTLTQLANIPGGSYAFYGGAYAYSDETTGDIYFSGGQAGGSLYRYSPESNTYTLIRSDMTVLNNGSWMTIGDTVYYVSDTQVIPIDPETGNTQPGPTPTNPGFATVWGYCAVSGNTMYLSHSTGLYKCVLYENIPEEAPIVAKIYKGQKYHTLQPFTIHGEGGDINVTTTQQTAAVDIPIKMYTYDNAGGQILIIENGGE